MPITMEDLTRILEHHNKLGGTQLNIRPSNSKNKKVDIYHDDQILLLSLDYITANHVIAALSKARAQDHAKTQEQLTHQLDAVILTCVHQFHSRDELYVSIHPNEKAAHEHIPDVMAEANYDQEDEREFFSSTLHHVAIDLNTFIEQLPPQIPSDPPQQGSTDQPALQLSNLAGKMEATKQIEPYEWDELFEAIYDLTEADKINTSQSINPDYLAAAASIYFIDKFGTEEHKETLVLSGLSGKSASELISLSKSNHSLSLYNQDKHDRQSKTQSLEHIIAKATAAYRPTTEQPELSHIPHIK